MEDDTMEYNPFIFTPIIQVKNVSVDRHESDPNATKLLRRLLEMEESSGPV